MNSIFLLLGSNLGDSVAYLEKAREHIASSIGRLVEKSSLYQSPPWGFDHKNDFMNQVLIVESELSPTQLLSQVLNIETILGRQRFYSSSYEARVIDIDILFFNDESITTSNLVIPHPRLHERRFTLVPLHELYPDFIHPQLKVTVSELLNQCSDRSVVRKYELSIH